MNKLEMAQWLLKRVGGKVNDMKYAELSDDALELVGDDIDTYIGMLGDILKEVILP